MVWTRTQGLKTWGGLVLRPGLLPILSVTSGITSALLRPRTEAGHPWWPPRQPPSPVTPEWVAVKLPITLETIAQMNQREVFREIQSCACAYVGIRGAKNWGERE